MHHRDFKQTQADITQLQKYIDYMSESNIVEGIKNIY